MSKKKIELWRDEGFEVGAIDLLEKYEPGPIYILTTETTDGTPAVFISEEPFTQEEAEAQHPLEFGGEEEGEDDE